MSEQEPQGCVMVGPDEARDSGAIIEDEEQGFDQPENGSREPEGREQIDSGFLTREDILGANDRAFEEKLIPEWGGKVLLCEMSAGQAQVFFGNEQFVGEDAPAYMQTVGLLIACVCDGEGNQLFTVDDAKALSEKSSDVIARIKHDLWRLNGMSSEKVEETVKNSKADPSGDSD